MELPINYERSHWKQRKAAREEYEKRQNHNCHYCGTPLIQIPIEVEESLKVNEKLFPKGFFNYPVHLHHCHKTGMTLGAVHAYCNAVLWQYHGE